MTRSPTPPISPVSPDIVEYSQNPMEAPHSRDDELLVIDLEELGSDAPASPKRQSRKEIENSVEAAQCVQDFLGVQTTTTLPTQPPSYSSAAEEEAIEAFCGRQS